MWRFFASQKYTPSLSQSWISRSAVILLYIDCGERDIVKVAFYEPA